MNSKDNFGDRMKSYEKAFETRTDRNDVTIVRLDGKGFSKFTKSMKMFKPYDERMIRMMRSITEQLINFSNAKLGYTQSDEITLAFWNDSQSPNSQIYFDGRVQKLASVLAACASTFFMKELMDEFAISVEDVYSINPVFDARVFSVPNFYELRNVFLWRMFDARRNSILGHAQVRFSHKAMQGVSCKELIDKMEKETDFNWNMIDEVYKYGYMLTKTLEARASNIQVENHTPGVHDCLMELYPKIKEISIDKFIETRLPSVESSEGETIAINDITFIECNIERCLKHN